MATNLRYPEGLRGCIQAGKSRSQQAGFRQSDPAAGPAYTERYTLNPPVSWSFSLIFNRYQAQIFMAWFRSATKGGALPFIMPIRTEEALIDHEVRFTASGVPQLVSETADIFTYQCTIVGRKIETIISDEDILVLFDMFGDNFAPSFSIIDVATNREWPRA